MLFEQKMYNSATTTDNDTKLNIYDVWSAESNIVFSNITTKYYHFTLYYSRAMMASGEINRSGCQHIVSSKKTQTSAGCCITIFSAIATARGRSDRTPVGGTDRDHPHGPAVDFELHGRRIFQRCNPRIPETAARSIGRRGYTDCQVRA